MTARELLETSSFLPDIDWEREVITVDRAEELMLEFAQSKVQEVIESIKQKIVLVEKMRTNGDEITDDVKFDNEMDFYIKKESILNAYSLENIK